MDWLQQKQQQKKKDQCECIQKKKKPQIHVYLFIGLLGEISPFLDKHYPSNGFNFRKAY